MLTDRASSSQRCDRVQNRSTTPTATATPTATQPALIQPSEGRFVGVTSGSAGGAVAWVFVTATARNGSLRTYCGPIICRAHPPLEHHPDCRSAPTAMADTDTGTDTDTDTETEQVEQVVIIGAGPAGLTAACELAKRGQVTTVLEADAVVGGISRTVERDGWRFDIGGHRFFTKVPEVETLWHEILPDEDFLLRPRMSRIYYKSKFFDYPLRAMNVLKVVGVWESFLCGCSYIWVRIKQPTDQTTFEGWTAARFGWRLYRIFFKTYTEKVWGMPADKRRRTGPLSASRTSRSARRSSTRCSRSGTRPTSPRSSRSSTTRSTAPG